MKKANQILPGCAMAVSYTAFLSWLFCMLQIDGEFTALAFSPLPLAFFYIAIYLFNCFLTKKNASLGLYVAFQLFFGAAAVALFLVTSKMEPIKTGNLILMGIFLFAGAIGCGYSATETYTPKKLIFYFDSVIVLLILLMLLDHLLTLSMVSMVMYVCFAAIALDIISLIASRLKQGQHPGQPRSAVLLGRIAVAALLVIILLLAFGLVSLGADSANSLSQAIVELLQNLGRTLKQLGSGFMRLLERFLTWLISFLPEPQNDTVELVSETTGIEGNYQSSKIPIPKWIWYIIGAAVLLGLIKFLLSMRKEKVDEEAITDQSVTQSARTGTLLSGLRELWALLCGKLRFFFLRIRNRNTAPGLLLWCESHAPKSGGRQPGESGSAFLLRLSQLELPEEQRKALRTLSAIVEQSFYSPQSPPLPAGLSKVIHRCKF